MKRFISVIIILAMALSLLVGIIPALAEESGENSGEDKAEAQPPTLNDTRLDTPSASYVPNWKTLFESGKMASRLDSEENDDFLELFEVKASADELFVAAKDGAELNEARTYFLTQLFNITATTYYEYEFKVSGVDSGVIIAYANEKPYILYGSFDNAQGDGDSAICLCYGTGERLVSGTNEEPCKLMLDGGFASFKVAYEGYRVSVYALVDDSAEGEWTHLEGLDFTLPKSAAICLGAYSEVAIKSAMLNAYNNESAAFLNGDISRAELFGLIYSTENIILSDYTEQTASALLLALSDAISALSDDSADVTEQKAALQAAISGLIIDIPDLYNLKMTYSMLKYSDEYRAKFHKMELAECLLKIESTLKKDVILNSDVAELESAIADISVASPIYNEEELLAMDAEGCYRLAANITLTESYPEFKGYLDGANYTITLDGASGVFTALNGADVIDLNIASANDLTSDVPSGALSAFATGKITVTGVVNTANLAVNDASGAGFIAECNGASIIFTNCINKGKIVGKSAAGFVAVALDGEHSDIAFKYCATLGSVESSGSVGAFFACGNASVIMYGCVVGGFDSLSVIASGEDACSLGGVIGSATAVSIDACYFNINLNVAKNTSSASSALVVGSVYEGAVEIRNLYLSGELVSLTDNEYRVTSASDAILESVLIFVSLKKEENGALTENESALDEVKNTDVTVLDEDSLSAALAETTGLVVAVTMGDSLDEKIKTTEQFILAVNSVKSCSEASLDKAKTAALALVLDAVKDPANYTAESYALYFADVELLISTIKSALDVSVLTDVDISGALALAEAKLVTPDEYAASLLAKAKLDALTVLSAKRENAGNVFTSASYNEYLIAFDAIVAQINNAQTLEALALVDVALLKVNAENKLIVATREAVLDDDDSNSDYGDLTPDGDDDAPDNDYGTVTDNSSGCASSLSLSALTLVSLLGTAFALKRD